MITLFSLPKAFQGHIGVIQNNAVGSWRALAPECQVILIGNEPGIEEAARAWNVEWIPDVERTPFGTPLLNSAFEAAAEKARYEWICYLNCDIIVFKDLLKLPSTATTPKTLFVGQRWDYDLTERIDFSVPNWEETTRQCVKEKGTLHPPLGSDYFLFRKDSGLCDLPPFAVGRPGWDCWFMYNARQKGFAVVDASPSICVIHQNHNYQHVPQGRGDYNGPEGDENMRIALQSPYLFTLEDASHVLTDNRVHRALSVRHLRRIINRFKDQVRGFARKLFGTRSHAND